MHYAIDKVPFSRFGSYFSLFHVKKEKLGEGLYIRVLSGQAPQVFKVEPIRDGEVLSYELETAPWSLTLKPKGGGEIVIVIDATDAIRIRGTGVSLRLEIPMGRWYHTYEQPGGAWVCTLNPHNVNLSLDPVQGGLEMDAPWEQGRGFCHESSKISATAVPDGGVFEIAVDQFKATWIRPARQAFDVACRDVEAEYASWSRNLPSAPTAYEPTRDLAAYVNWSAVVRPAGCVTRPTMFMSKTEMCNVYHWDHAFNAMAHCLHQPALAWDQLVLMHDHQDEDGKPPSNLNRDRMGWTMSNPPVQGWALRRMWDLNPDMFTPERQKEAYTYLSGWTNWICNHRTWPGDILPYYIHGFDGGWDNSTIFDKGVPVVTPCLSSYLILQMETLRDLAEALGMTEATQEWQTRRDAMLAALLAELWKDDHFVGRLRPSGEIVECESLIICMPMVLGKRLPAEIRTALVARIQDHLTVHGLATEKLNSPKYLENGYWRGPIWAPVTMLIVCGLLEVGETALAARIIRGFCQMCKKVGFYENFDAKTGEGCWDTAYTWTSSVFMIFTSQYADLLT